MASLKAYGKVDEADQQRLEARRKTRKRITIIALSSIILVGVIVGAVVGTTSVGKHKNSSAGSRTQSLSTSIKAVCDVTLYPNSCYTSLQPMVNSTHVQPEDLFKLSIYVAINELSRASHYFSSGNGVFKGVTDNMSVAALESCRELVGLALDNLNTSYLSTADLTSLNNAFDDLKTWLSSAGTCLQTCIDGFDVATETLKSGVLNYLQNSTEFTSNSLAIINEFSNLANSFKLRRRLMSFTHDGDSDMPHWLSAKDRKLLGSSTTTKIKADAVVAMDGSGNYKTINDALKAVPDESKKRFVIYVKKGVYNENVRVEKSMWNVMMVGDGMNATIVSGSLNFVDGTPCAPHASFIYELNRK